MDVDYFLYESSEDSTFYFNNDDLNYSSYNISKLEIQSENEGEFDYLIFVLIKIKIILFLILKKK